MADASPILILQENGALSVHRTLLAPLFKSGEHDSNDKYSFPVGSCLPVSRW